ncbi:MAG TPA: exopolysaccharide biosynthesis polyprenyl glycosylphosphotransferase [Candidatus Koribacter sp.]|jgi:exopolysaccharide biosynthesis polyprenyl glycosylphosphotransferase
MATPANFERSASQTRIASLGAVAASPQLSIRDSAVLAIWIGIGERLFDFLAIVLAVFAADFVYRFSHVGRRVSYPSSWITLGAVAFAGLCVLLLENFGEYKSGSLLGVRETERILRTTSYGILLFFPLAYFSGHPYSRLLVLFVAIGAPLVLMIERQLMYRLTGAICRVSNFGRPSIIYGSGRPARKVYSALLRSPKLGFRPIAFVDENENMSGREVFEASYHRRQSAKVLPGPINVDLLRELEVSTVILSEPPADAACRTILAAAHEAGVSVLFPPGHVGDEHSYEYLEIDGFLFSQRAATPEMKLYDVAKRCFDVVVSLLLLILLAPVLLSLVALVKFSSKGPVFFVQERVGRRGTIFPMFKFRSMYTDVPVYAFSPRKAGDPRITPVGRFLRRTSLDELPQLLNVLRGDMALVGPRPEMPFIVETYSPAQRRRLEVTPGITGLWQLSADRAYLIHENIEYDLYYVRNRSFFLDLAILVHTALFAARGV